MSFKPKFLSLLLGSIFAGGAFAASTIDMVVAMDESGSMSGEHNAFIGSYIHNLDLLLNNQKVTVNQYGLVGFGGSPSAYYSVPANEGGRETSNSALYHYFNLTTNPASKLSTEAQFGAVTNQLVTNGGTEDGYRAMDYILRNYQFRKNAGASIMLITDESRDNDTNNLAPGVTEQSLMDIEKTLAKDKVVVHAVLSQRLTDKQGNPAIAVVGADPNTGYAYVQQPNGVLTKVQGYVITPTYDDKSYAGSNTTEAYAKMALRLGGTVMDIDRLRTTYQDPAALAALSQELAQLIAQVSAGQAVIGLDCAAAIGQAARICAALGNSSGSNLQNILDHLSQFSGGALNAELRRLAPVNLGVFGQTIFANTRFFQRIIGQRLNDLRFGGPRADLGSLQMARGDMQYSGDHPFAGQLTGGGASADRNDGSSFYVRGAYTRSRLGDTSDSVGYTSDAYTLAAGMDKALNRQLQVGAAFAYTNSDASSSDNFGSTKGDSYSLSAYGSYQFKPDWYVEGILGAGTSNFRTSRDTGVGIASAKPKASQWNAMLGVMTNIAGENGVSWQPHARLRFTSMHVNSYTESGGAAVSVDSHTLNSTVSDIGASISKAFNSGWVAQLQASWEHEFGDTIHTVNSSFVADPTVIFSSNTPQRSQDYGVLGLAVFKDIGMNRTISMRFDSVLGYSDYHENTLEFRFRQAF